jgi:hypothetical protein
MILKLIFSKNLFASKEEYWKQNQAMLATIFIPDTPADALFYGTLLMEIGVANSVIVKAVILRKWEREDLQKRCFGN